MVKLNFSALVSVLGPKKMIHRLKLSLPNLLPVELLYCEDALVRASENWQTPERTKSGSEDKEKTGTFLRS